MFNKSLGVPPFLSVCKLPNTVIQNAFKHVLHKYTCFRSFEYVCLKFACVTLKQLHIFTAGHCINCSIDIDLQKETFLSRMLQEVQELSSKEALSRNLDFANMGNEIIITLRKVINLVNKLQYYIFY